MRWLRETTYTTVVVNNTIYDLELYEKTNGGSKMLQVLKSKPQVKEGNINDEPRGESSSFEVKIMDKTDETYKLLVKMHHQPPRQLSIPRIELIGNQRIIIQYDEEQGLLTWHEEPDIHGTMNSKRPYEKKQKPNDPNGEHSAKQAAKDVIRSPRETRRQLLPDLENSQHKLLQSKRGSQECIEPNFPKNVTPREDQKNKK